MAVGEYRTPTDIRTEFVQGLREISRELLEACDEWQAAIDDGRTGDLADLYLCIQGHRNALKKLRDLGLLIRRGILAQETGGYRGERHRKKRDAS